MKNLFLSAVLVLSFSFTGLNAKDAETVKVECKQEKAYKKIETTAVPVGVLKQMSEKYAGYNVSQAYAAEDGSEFKVELSKDSNAVAVYYSAAGEFIKEIKRA